MTLPTVTSKQVPRVMCLMVNLIANRSSRTKFTSVLVQVFFQNIQKKLRFFANPISREPSETKVKVLLEVLRSTQFTLNSFKFHEGNILNFYKWWISKAIQELPFAEAFWRHFYLWAHLFWMWKKHPNANFLIHSKLFLKDVWPLQT